MKTPKGPKLVKAPHLGCRECKCGLICWQWELTEIKLIAQRSALRTMELTETRAAVCQVLEAPTARDTFNRVQLKDYMALTDVPLDDVLFHFE